MKQAFTFLLLLAGMTSLVAQLPNQNFNDFATISCPFDEAITIDQPVDWILYQTLDNTWNGPIDSSICVQVNDIGFGVGVPSSSFDYHRPLFCRSQLAVPYPILDQHNWVYENTIFISTDGGGNLLKTTNDCENAICTGIITEILVPNEDGSGLNARPYYGELRENYADLFVNCLPTERFIGENYIGNYVLKITVDTTVAGTDFEVYLQYNDFNPLYYITPIAEDLSVPEWAWNGATYEITVPEIYGIGGFFNNFLVLYGEDDYPSEDFLHFREVTPEVNPDEQRTINLAISHYDGGTHFQPFVTFRGGLVAGSDTLRHTLNLINMGPMCLNFLEVIFQQNTNFVYRSGEIEMTGPMACMQFRNNAALVVDDNATLVYGKKGTGVLGLRTGGTIRLGHNSHLLINNELRMWAYEPKSGRPEDRDIYMELNPGSTLEFGELASLTDPYPGRGPMHLNIYMNGGTLIDEQLSPEERQLIRKIYPTISNDIAQNISVQPNPVQDMLQLEYLCGVEEKVQLRLYDEAGRPVREWVQQADKGLNRWTMEVRELPRGIYILNIQAEHQGRYTQKVILP
ncbi:MAG: T9SS type A sorting domain-containing protein [Phaeodactylibacter sp.]|nr:T9SS type A sorting domain-containing protein [Phaeodactylibacter sp.]